MAAGAVFAELAAVLEAEQFCGRRSGHGGDFVDVIFAGDARQRRVGERLLWDARQCFRPALSFHQQREDLRIGGKGSVIGVVRGEENAVRIGNQQEQLKAAGPLDRVAQRRATRCGFGSADTLTAI